MSAETKRNIACGLWLIAIITTGIGCGLLADSFGCNYLSNLVFVATCAAGGLVGSGFFSSRKGKPSSVAWWKWLLAATAVLAFAGLLTRME